MENPQSPQTLYIIVTFLYSDGVLHSQNKLTSVGVQTEATGAVACLDSV